MSAFIEAFVTSQIQIFRDIVLPLKSMRACLVTDCCW